MNPVEWLLYAAAFDVFHGPRRLWSPSLYYAAVEVIATLEKRL